MGVVAELTYGRGRARLCPVRIHLIQEGLENMAEITAAAVKDLREKSVAGMMDCKKELNETGGDMTDAMDLLRFRRSCAT